MHLMSQKIVLLVKPFGGYKPQEVNNMGRKWNLVAVNVALLDATNALRTLRADDVKARKSKSRASLKPKFTADIDKIDLLLETIVISRKILIMH